MTSSNPLEQQLMQRQMQGQPGASAPPAGPQEPMGPPPPPSPPLHPHSSIQEMLATLTEPSIAGMMGGMKQRVKMTDPSGGSQEIQSEPLQPQTQPSELPTTPPWARNMLGVQ